MSYALMLTPNWPGTFRRSLIDAEGNLVKLCVFAPNVPQLVSDDEFAVLQGDVGKALCYAKRDRQTGEPIPKVDAFDGDPPVWSPPSEVGSDEASLSAPPANDGKKGKKK